MENKQITFGQAISLRVKELMDKNGIKNVNQFANLSLIPKTTLTDLVLAKYEFPSTKSLFVVCKFFNMELEEFFSSPYFYLEFLQYKD